MKKNIGIKICILLASLLTVAKSQTTVSVCAGNSVVVSAQNSQGLSNPSFSLNPGGVISSNVTFTVSPATAVIYTLYVTGTDVNSATITTSTTVQVVLTNPTYSVVSPESFTLGCGVKNVCQLNIINAQTLPPGGPMSYSFFAPGSSTLLPLGPLSANSTITTSVPGSWSVVVIDNTSSCATWTTLTISTNTQAPFIGIVSVPQQTLSCFTPSTQLQASPNPAVQYKWMFVGTPGTLWADSIPVYANTFAFTQTLVNTYTLVAIDNVNTCESNTVMPIYQNVFPPNASIMGLGTSCSPTVVLTNASSSGIPNGTFPNALPIVSFWNMSPSQSTVGASSSFTVQSSGVYTMTVIDMNNGCTDMETKNVTLGLTAAFVHTITGGQAIFNNASVGTPTNSTYYWDFGDGNTSTLENPTHNYLFAGAYLVKFKINSGTYCINTVIQSVNISGAPCSANSNFSATPTNTAQVWDIFPAYPWNITAAKWSWGDGSFSNTLYTSHQYASAGVYNICLSVTVSCGDTSTTCISYNIYKGTEASLMLQVNVVSPALISGLSSAELEEQISWELFPNPNAGEFKLKMNTVSSEATHVLISDLSGRIVYDQLLESDSEAINSSGLSSGMYFVTIQNAKFRSTKRMVVSH